MMDLSSARRLRKTGWLSTLLAGVTASALGFATLAGLVVSTASPAHAAIGSILIIAPHPDDDVLLTSGVIHQAVKDGRQVRTVFMTNGDGWPDPTAVGETTKQGVGIKRQGEAVSAQAELGMTNEDNLIFLGYPDGYLQQVLAGGPVVAPASSVTYGSRGLGRADYHQYKTGSHAVYTRENVVADLMSILSDFRPDDVFTTSEYDQPYDTLGLPVPGDHNATNQFVRDALTKVVGSNPSYAPNLHSGIVWTANPNETATVPAPAGTWPNAINPAQPFAPIPAHSTAIYPAWASRESIPVHNDLKNTTLAANPKYRAIGKHETQGGTANPFLANFVHYDEVFWITEMGIAKLVVAVSGTGNFGTVPVGTPVSRSITISNAGTKPLIISGLTLSGAGFSATALPAIGTSIAGGASVAATLTYLPTAATTNAGALTITSDSGGSVTTELVGGGASPEPTVVVAPGAASRSGYWMLDAAGNVYAFR